MTFSPFSPATLAALAISTTEISDMVYIFETLGVLWGEGQGSGSKEQLGDDDLNRFNRFYVISSFSLRWSAERVPSEWGWNPEGVSQNVKICKDRESLAWFRDAVMFGDDTQFEIHPAQRTPRFSLSIHVHYVMWHQLCLKAWQMSWQISRWWFLASLFSTWQKRANFNRGVPVIGVCSFNASLSM